jgi:uncharacterized membrane protein
MSDQARSDAPFDLTSERLEAFCDAVTAVIITILAPQPEPRPRDR